MFFIILIFIHQLISIDKIPIFMIIGGESSYLDILEARENSMKLNTAINRYPGVLAEVFLFQFVRHI